MFGISNDTSKHGSHIQHIYFQFNLRTSFGVFANLRLRGNGNDPYAADGTVFMYCQTGQNVWVQNDQGSGTTLDSLSTSYFTVTLVQRDIGN